MFVNIKDLFMPKQKTISAKAVIEYWEGQANKHPKIDEEQLSHINGQTNQARFFYSKKYNIAYRPTPKCASTSIKSVFFQIHYHKPFNPRDMNSPDIHKYFQANYKQVEVNPENSFAFAVARDPIKRFISGYRNRVLHHENIKKLLDIDGQKYKPPLLSDFALSLPGFIKISVSVAHHMSLQKLILGDNLQKYSQIFKIEELSDLMAELMKRTKLAVELPREQNYGPLFQLSGLSDDAFEYLLDFYKQDYDLLANQYTLESIKSEYFSQKK